MPEDQIQDIIDGIRSRVQSELDSQLSTIAERHNHAVGRARQTAEAEAEQRWTARLESTEAEWALRLDADITAARAEAEREWQEKLESTRNELSSRLDADITAARAEAEREWQARLESTRSEWSSRLDAEVAAARAEAERRIAAESMRARVEAEQSAAETSGAIRHELEQALAAERRQAHARLEAERERAERDLSAARSALDAERNRLQAVVAPAADNGANLDAARLLDAMREIDQAGSLSDVLGLTAAGAAAEAPRVAVFVANGPQLEEWTVPALPALSAAPVRIAGPESGVLGAAVTTGEVHLAGANGAGAPAFASLSTARAAIAVPLKVGAQTVAVLYADEGREGDVATGWSDAIQILGRHASASLAFLTALRTSQAMQLMSAGAAAAASRSTGDDDQGARRYARLLVSEIKLYNEAAVRVGREKRDLSRRLKPEIERARRLFDERIPQSVSGRDDCFQQELVQTLADGDPSLLG
jgi:hypothetical protein